MTTTLYGFFRSGTSHRLRIALNLKGLQYEQVAVDLRREEHLGAAFRSINPQGLVPALLSDDSVLVQSPAIIEWLDECHPQPPLLPQRADQRAHVRALAAIIACDVHPVNNRRILEALRQRFGAGDAAIDAWCAGWIGDGLDAYCAQLERHQQPGRFSYGDAPGLADLYLIPQLESARRFKVDLARWPRLLTIEQACLELDAFRRAAPMAQADAA